MKENINNTNFSLKNPLILALDVDTLEEAQSWIKKIGPQVGAIKLGPRLNYRYGAELTKFCSDYSAVFIDNKYFDITSTMLAAIKASFEAGASLVTVHALAGPNTLLQLANLESDLQKIRPFKILCVTILTSWDHTDIASNFIQQSPNQHVLSLALLVRASGLSGLVCSAHELDSLSGYANFFKVTPGIRLGTVTKDNNEFKTQEPDDQKRIMTPQQALKSGASALVIGRPILNSAKPEKIVDEILSSLT